MTIATTSSTAQRSLLRHIPDVALALAGAAVVLLALGPIGWRAGWWHYRFSLLTLMPWAAYFGLAAVNVSVLALAIGFSRLDWRGIALAFVALIGGGLMAYVPWHYDQVRQAVPPIHDITTDTDNPPAFVAVVPLRQGEGVDPVAYEGAKIAEQQRRAYPDIATSFGQAFSRGCHPPDCSASSGRGPVWVMGGKPRTEHIFFGFPPITDL
jgi:hypothetical protein